MSDMAITIEFTMFAVLGCALGFMLRDAYGIWITRRRKPTRDAPTDGAWKAPSDFWR